MGRGYPESLLQEQTLEPAPWGRSLRVLAGDQLADQVPSGFNCASSWIFIVPPPLSPKGSPAGHIRGHEERHAALASPCGPLWSRDRPVNLWALPFIFPGTTAVCGQGLAEPTFPKSLWKDKGAALHSPCPGLGCLLRLLALCPGWQSQGQWELLEGPCTLPASRRGPKDAHSSLPNLQGRWAEVCSCMVTPSPLSCLCLAWTPLGLGMLGSSLANPFWMIGLVLPRGHGQRGSERGQICPHQLQ